MNGQVNLEGKFTYVVKDSSGKVKAQGSGKNLVTDAGDNLMAQLLDYNTAPAEPQWVAIGSGSSTPTKVDTVLQAESPDPRTIATSGSVTDNALTLVFTVTTVGAFSMREVGIFNAATVGVCFSRFLTQVVDLGASDTIDFTWVLTFLGT